MANPTHGSGWIVQSLPTKDDARIPGNPTHGSGWIVQVLPASEGFVIRVTRISSVGG
ncbi:MAG TPA: hypothetical protein VKF81_09155 [Blastocatellia bacterium]|nr:hypothetical protein [Blastocatellia bacterium]